MSEIGDWVCKKICYMNREWIVGTVYFDARDTACWMLATPLSSENDNAPGGRMLMVMTLAFSYRFFFLILC